MTLVNDWKPLRNVAKSSILDVAGALHMPRNNAQKQSWWAIPQSYKGVEDIANQNECFDANDDDDTCDDGNSKMSSDNILTKKKGKLTTQSVKQLTTQLACRVQIINYKLTLVRHILTL